MVHVAAWCMQLYAICNSVPNAFICYTKTACYMHHHVHHHMYTAGSMHAGSIKEKLSCILVSLANKALGTDVMQLCTD